MGFKAKPWRREVDCLHGPRTKLARGTETRPKKILEAGQQGWILGMKHPDLQVELQALQLQLGLGLRQSREREISPVLLSDLTEEQC